MSAVDPGQFKIDVYEKYEAAECNLDCSKCGGTVTKVGSGGTSSATLLAFARVHVCLPEIRKGFG